MYNVMKNRIPSINVFFSPCINCNNFETTFGDFDLDTYYLHKYIIYKKKLRLNNS